MSPPGSKRGPLSRWRVTPESSPRLRFENDGATRAALLDACRDARVAPTTALVRLASLASEALDFREPVLLVGETGGGKTTVCELLAKARGYGGLTVINCHMHSEAADFLGALRPARRGDDDDDDDARASDAADAAGDAAAADARPKALFEWVDGALVTAMKRGDVVLLDELNLADDAVLERLNSVLEPGASRGGLSSCDTTPSFESGRARETTRRRRGERESPARESSTLVVEAPSFRRAQAGP